MMQTSMMQTPVSINALSQPLVKALIQDAPILNIGVSKHACGATIIDAGITHTGSAEAGRRIAEICMGGLGEVTLCETTQVSGFAASIRAESKHPVLACLASQYAGWSLSHEKFFSLGSGPARCIAQREDIFKELLYTDRAESTVLVLETDKIPPTEIFEKIARDTQLNPAQLTLILTPTTSIAGAVQIVGRVLEVALHKAHTVHFPLENILSGFGVAVLPSVSADFMTAMGRTNDAILFGGFVQLTVDCADSAAEELAQQLPSSASKDYGKTFAEVFKSYNMDFYKIDPLLFSPAKVEVINQKTGKHFMAGAFNQALIEQSFKD